VGDGPKVDEQAMFVRLQHQRCLSSDHPDAQFSTPTMQSKSAGIADVDGDMSAAADVDMG
jgi:hypothetical protein